ncbi:MAG: T9SS type A sorting domain-containing protein [Bacteroidota bacterium]
MLNTSLRSIATIIFFCLFCSISAQPPAPSGKMWEAVPELSDEFDFWDTSKWFKSLWNYGVPVQMRAENSGVANGKLWIKATLDTSSTRWFQTSRIWSRTQISYPMYTECSMKTAHISGYNTFWMNNGDINNRDEIDICENNSKPSITSYTSWPYLMQSQYFLTVNGNDERAKGNFDNRNLADSNPLQGVPWNEAYHTLGVWWKDKNNVQFYLDGEPAGSVSTTRDFTRSLNIIWDLWTIDAQWSGGIAAQADLMDDSINTMRVDWIHTYRLVSDGSVDIEPEKEAVKVKVFPNPVKDHLQLEFLEYPLGNAKIEVFDQLGKLVRAQALTRSNQQLSFVDLPPALYMLKITNGEAVNYQKVLKR